MCTICAELSPWTEDCMYSGLYDAAGESTADASLPVYSYDQIADQLTTGYWGGGPYSFDATSGDTLFVDLTGLTESGQQMARQALQAWTDVTGLVFAESNDTPASLVHSESVDASSGTLTAYSMTVGDDFQGSLTGTADRDAVAINLSAGQRITIEMTGDDRSGNALDDPYLRLRDSSGTIIVENDDAYGTDSTIALQVEVSGTYYIQAGSYLDASLGDYTVSVRNAPVADITFDDNNSGAYASFWTSGSTITQATVNIEPTWAGGAARTDGYYYQTYLHEIGHALGLGHAGNYNGSASYATDAHYANDSWQASVMSYFYQTENTWLDASFAYVITPQIADIIAAQSLYGTPDTRAGDDTYGNNGNTGTYLDSALNLSNPVSFTVFDSGGIDTFDFSEETANQRLDLREEMFSDLAGLTGNIGIARGTVIEYGLTGTGDDNVTGNASDNGLNSGAGNDFVSAGAGHDALSGAEGLDDLNGDKGRDLIEGGAGSDLVNGGDDGDLIFGDYVTLDTLLTLFPTWTPPPNAQSILDTGDLLAIWDDILLDVYAIA